MNSRTEEMRLLLSEMKISQRQAAEALGVNVRTVRYWMAANPPPPVIAIYALHHLKQRH